MAVYMEPGHVEAAAPLSLTKSTTLVSTGRHSCKQITQASSSLKETSTSDQSKLPAVVLCKSKHKCRPRTKEADYVANLEKVWPVLPAPASAVQSQPTAIVEAPEAKPKQRQGRKREFAIHKVNNTHVPEEARDRGCPEAVLIEGAAPRAWERSTVYTAGQRQGYWASTKLKGHEDIHNNAIQASESRTIGNKEGISPGVEKLTRRLLCGSILIIMMGVMVGNAKGLLETFLKTVLTNTDTKVRPSDAMDIRSLGLRYIVGNPYKLRYSVWRLMELVCCLCVGSSFAIDPFPHSPTWHPIQIRLHLSNFDKNSLPTEVALMPVDGDLLVYSPSFILFGFFTKTCQLRRIRAADQASEGLDFVREEHLNKDSPEILAVEGLPCGAPVLMAAMMEASGVELQAPTFNSPS
ncbi:hypothetical protein BDK51DRAFT_52316 [Blyttiomyces helicus]|uniref:Uncharacterized protein n=1 Tax=Blyttiomyces helicus TaxID=388810 RepID=A0A4P9W490_9FUNG|nr:hypothetical protein BDK51DRAFT_52316 [Blyttiomyces helicus]|eukprot:RKO87161.1 hypothetical protein BDK51DRAFT_52316 [Blyttiomyces helicus]